MAARMLTYYDRVKASSVAPDWTDMAKDLFHHHHLLRPLEKDAVVLDMAVEAVVSNLLSNQIWFTMFDIGMFVFF